MTMPVDLAPSLWIQPCCSLHATINKLQAPQNLIALPQQLYEKTCFHPLQLSAVSVGMETCQFDKGHSSHDESRHGM